MPFAIVHKIIIVILFLIVVQASRAVETVLWVPQEIVVRELLLAICRLLYLIRRILMSCGVIHVIVIVIIYIKLITLL